MPEVPFSDFGIRWFEDIVEKITEWFTEELTTGYEEFLENSLSTPLPNGQGLDLIFTKPAESDGIWHGIYESTVAGETTIFALVILFLCVQGHHFIRIFNYGSAHEARKARRASWVGALLTISWYWIGVLALYFVEGLTIGLIPNMQQVGSSVISLLPQAAGTPGLTLVMASLGGLAMVALKALFIIRELLLYVYLYGMPFGIAIAYGNVPVLSNIARRLIAQFIPLAALPLPAAILFRGYELLFAGEHQLELGGQFAQYLVVISLPIITLYVTWKTFKFAAPLAARAIGGTGRGAILAGTVATAGYLAGPTAAAAGARWGPTAAAGTALASRQAQPNGSGAQTQRAAETSDSDDGGGGSGGIPEYRRSENDPGYY
ncbi:hypothetical protein HWV07_15645 [Natronomonas salina]|uniref:hypothetical protein n=1 Tax=Natronomonas salina TaxID=1710540 RepID=UPI0015B675AF|nr:hypothetical protein [Natronomonas salina]QLD90390.1 hypothetical protein HWV07_15645 [Natronomonas salina]